MRLSEPTDIGLSLAADYLLQNSTVMITATQKLNLQTAYPEYYTAAEKPKVVNLEPYYYLTISGKCAPEHPMFEEAIGQLYALAYKVKFNNKANEMDFVVPKLEAFWWVEGETPFEKSPREQWCWKLMIRMPDFIGGSEVGEALQTLITDKKIPSNHKLQFEEIHEGLCIQILHNGSYEAEWPTIQKLLQYAQREGFEVIGRHHEIYLNDPMKTISSKLKTILRYSIQ